MMQLLEKIKLIVLDVDGTMTDGGVYIDNNEIETKKFNIKDGAGILLAQSVGINFMILTGRESGCVRKRASELNIKYVHQGIKNKEDFLENFICTSGYEKENIAYIGDDLNDLKAMKYCQVNACPIDAAQEVKEQCQFVLTTKGGYGVVREFVEILLKNNGKWEEAVNNLF